MKIQGDKDLHVIIMEVKEYVEGFKSYNGVSEGLLNICRSTVKPQANDGKRYYITAFICKLLKRLSLH